MTVNKFQWAIARFQKFTIAVLWVAAVALYCSVPLSAQQVQLPAGIGIIEGDNIEVKTPVGAGIESHFAPTVVASGSDVTVSEGSGRILLDGGGDVSICGPAHFTLFRAGDAVTLALDYGRVHPSIDAAASLTIFTPIVVATPVAIAGARRNTTIGLDQTGAMCILTDRGAVRIQQQLSNQSLVIPQGNSADLIDGQVVSLHADPASCTCDYSRAAVDPTPSPKDQLAAITPPIPPAPIYTAAATEPVSAAVPQYIVTLPPLSFDASVPQPPPDPSPESMLLVSEVHIQPDAEFHGHVNPVSIASPQEPTVGANPALSQPSPDAQSSSRKSGGGFGAHLRDFFRSLGGRPPCEGSGCGK